ncbi:hypothetical protein ACFL6S_07620 [Candidatus Poribacteria bacterium]
MSFLKRILRKLYDLKSSKPYRLANLRILTSEMMQPRRPVEEAGPEIQQASSVHAQAAMDWLCAAQDTNDDGGVAALYSLGNGWAESYPETTGYIIPTFFKYHAYTNNEEYRQRAIRMADWEISVQLDNGAFHTGYSRSRSGEPCVFNTGQIIFGLVAAFVETSNIEYLKAAERAGDWLISIQGEDGVWEEHTYRGIPHTYSTRVSWALLELNEVLPKKSYETVAIQNLDWALGNQLENGWFDKASFDGKLSPFTHTIAYVIEGLLGSGMLLDNQKMMDAAFKTAESLLSAFDRSKYMPGVFDENWHGKGNYSCLTGDAQISIIWQQIYQLTNENRYLDAAVEMNNHLKSLQNLSSSNPGIRGGIRGSYPIWGGYIPYSYLNWAAKFFVDALLLESKLLRTEGIGG